MATSRFAKPAAAKAVATKPVTAKRATWTSSSLGAAPAEYHAPATTVAKIRAAAANERNNERNRAPAFAKAAPVAKATPVTKAAPKKVQKVQRRPGKPTTLTVSPAAIDAALAAEVAANMVLNHMVSGPAAGKLEKAVTAAFTQAAAAAKSPSKRETSTFKHLKETVANPTSHQLDGLFGVIATGKRPSLPFNPHQPGGPVQHIDKAFGLDVKRTHLPRRKAG